MCGSPPPIGISTPSVGGGCGSATGGGGSGVAAPVNAAAPVAAYATYPSYTSTFTMPAQTTSYAAQGTQFVAQADITDGRVRNPQRAAQTLASLKAATQNIDTPAKAAAAGYHPNPAAPDHWINDDIFRTRNGYDITRPATLMFEGNRLTGVMLSHNPALGNPPDLGAGAWHTHFSNDEYAAHVYLDGRALDQAFGKEHGDI